MRLSVVISLVGVVVVQSCGPRPSSLPQPVRTTPIAARPVVPGAPSYVTAIVDVGVVPMDTDRVLEHQTVLVEGGRVAALGATDAVVVPRGAVRIDGRDRYLMPGLGMCQDHVGIASVLGYAGLPGMLEIRITDHERFAKFVLFAQFASGHTGIRDMDYVDRDTPIGYGIWQWGLNGGERLRLRDQANAGQLWSPRMYITGQWAPKQYLGYQWQIVPESMPFWPKPRLDSVAAYVATYKATGYDFLKLHSEHIEIADSALAAARRIGLQVGGHVIDSLAYKHGDNHYGGDQAHALAGGQRVADHAGGIPQLREFSGDTAAYWSAVAAMVRARRQAGMWTCDGDNTEYGKYSPNGMLADSGAGLLGSGLRGISYMLAGGLTPYQALATVTKNFGQYLLTFDPHGDETGTIAVGRRADLLLLDVNPLALDRRAWDTLTPAVVMIGGRWLARSELDRRLAVYRQLVQGVGREGQMVAGIAGDSSFTPPVRQEVARLDSVHQAQAFALAERFVLTDTVPAGGPDSLRGPQLLAELFARQLGEIRATCARSTLNRDSKACK